MSDRIEVPCSRCPRVIRIKHKDLNERVEAGRTRCQYCGADLVLPEAEFELVEAEALGLKDTVTYHCWTCDTHPTSQVRALVTKLRLRGVTCDYCHGSWSFHPDLKPTLVAAGIKLPPGCFKVPEHLRAEPPDPRTLARILGESQSLKIVTELIDETQGECALHAMGAEVHFDVTPSGTLDGGDRRLVLNRLDQTELTALTCDEALDIRVEHDGVVQGLIAPLAGELRDATAQEPFGTLDELEPGSWVVRLEGGAELRLATQPLRYGSAVTIHLGMPFCTPSQYLVVFGLALSLSSLW